MIKLAKYLKPHIVAAILAPLFMVLEVGMDLLQPMFMASIIDDGIVAGSNEHIWKVGAYMICAAILGLIGGVGCTIYSAKASMRFGEDLRQDVFDKVQQFSFRNIDTLESGSIITRLTNDIVQIQNVVQMLLRVLVRSPLLMIGSLIMTIVISPKLAIIVAISVPLLFIIMFFIIKATLPLFTKVQSKLDKVNMNLQENLTGIRVSKAFVRRTYEEERFAENNEQYTKHSIKAQRLVAINGPILTMIMNISVIAVLLLGGKDVIHDSFAIGSLVAFINYVTQLLFSVTSVAMNLVRVSSAKVSSDRVIEVLETNSEIVQSQVGYREIKGQITFENVSFHYNENCPALHHINLSINQGEKVAILGATGSGKSTLLQLIPRLYDTSEGELYIDQLSVKQYDFEALRSQTAIVLQESILFSGTILENIRYGRPDATLEEVIEVAKISCAHDFITQMKDGYDSIIGQRGINLSGGQKQRISIARALLMKPKILLLDDSTSAIDTRTESHILSHLRETMSNCTIVMVAQKISSVLDADQIIILEHGEIIAQGNHANLLTSSPAYREIYESQLGEEDVDNE